MDKRYEGDREVAKQFQKRWELKCEEIKEQSLSSASTELIHSSFLAELNALVDMPGGPGLTMEEFTALLTDIHHAMVVAYSNYKKDQKKNSVWARMKNKIILFNKE